MSNAIAPEFATALINAQGVAITAECSADAAKFTALVLGNSAKVFATLAFEDEPSGYTAALRRNAP